MNIDDIPEFPGYLGVSRVAQLFGITKTGVYYKIYDQRVFRHVYKVAGNEDGQRPTLMLWEPEVMEVLKRETDEREKRGVPLRDRVSAWNKRVKQWGRDTGWNNGAHIHDTGRPHNDLVSAYLASNPDDPRPE